MYRGRPFPKLVGVVAPPALTRTTPSSVACAACGGPLLGGTKDQLLTPDKAQHLECSSPRTTGSKQHAVPHM